MPLISFTIMLILRGCFRGVSEVSRNHSGFVPRRWVRLFSAYKVSRSIHSMLNSGVTGFCFESKLRKCSDDPFLSSQRKNWRPLQKFVLERHWKLCAKIQPLNSTIGTYSVKSLEPPLLILPIVNQLFNS